MPRTIQAGTNILNSRVFQSESRCDSMRLQYNEISKAGNVCFEVLLGQYVVRKGSGREKGTG